MPVRYQHTQPEEHRYSLEHNCIAGVKNQQPAQCSSLSPQQQPGAADHDSELCRQVTAKVTLCWATDVTPTTVDRHRVKRDRRVGRSIDMAMSPQEKLWCIFTSFTYIYYISMYIYVCNDTTIHTIYIHVPYMVHIYIYVCNICDLCDTKHASNLP